MSFFPFNLGSLLPNPQTPWRISPELFQRLDRSTPDDLFKQSQIYPQDPEYEFILKYFCAHPPTGYSISKVLCIHTSVLMLAFEAELQTMEAEAQKFPPRWQEEPDAKQRNIAHQNWKTTANVFSPLHIQSPKHTRILTSAKVLPLWHGSSSEKAASICGTGFTYFGKHHFFHSSAKKGSLGSTDMGYFGSGIYFTSSARYATLYSQGNLLLSWVSMREPYPVISDVPLSKSKCTDMQILEGRGAYQSYNAHYIPVTSLTPDDHQGMIYFPCYEDQIPSADEIVVFSRSQTLPRFWIQVSVDTPSFLAPQYNREDLHTAAYTGELSVLNKWITEDPKRLHDQSDKRENLWHTSIRGDRLDVLQLLHRQDLKKIQESDERGSTLLHLACALGHRSIMQWLNEQDPDLLKTSDKDKWTPLHLAAFNEHLELLDPFFDQLPTDLLMHLASRPCPKALAYLLDKGVIPPIHSLKQTLLHLAAQTAQEENIYVLLDRGFDLEAQDLQGRTPLFLATLQGHRSTVQLLLQKGARLETQSNEQETLLHIAAFYGYVQVLKEFLQHPVGIKLLEAQDLDGKTPLHKAVWGPPKLDVVKMLLEKGANSNALNKYGYTPLHWAAKHGHVESTKLLLKYKGSPDFFNANGDTPLDLALYYHQDDIFHALLGTQRRLKPQKPPSKDLEAFYFDRLLKAWKKKYTREQVLYLIKLSDNYIDLSQTQHKLPTSQHNHLLKAAKLLNSGLALLERSLKSYPSLQASLFRKLEKIERFFLSFQGMKEDCSYVSHAQLQRTNLRKARQHCQEQLQKQELSLEISKELTQRFKQILVDLITTSVQALGSPPVPWAAICMGSMSRGEMCPYSDIEFAFLLKQESPQALNYFRTLSQFLQLCIINLGETTFPVFGEMEPSPTCDGFCMDTGGNTPLGVEGWYELIGTPEKLAHFQTKQWMDENLILTNTLNCVCLITGEEKLLKNYEKAKDKVALSYSSKTSPSEKVKSPRLFGKNEKKKSPPTFRQTLALHLLRGHLAEFEPDLSSKKEEVKAFGIKKELYRPLQEVLSSLALFYNLEAKSSVEKIEALVKLGVFSQEGGARLQMAVSQIVSLRLKAHLFYQTEQEFLLHLEPHQPRNPSHLYLEEETVEQLQMIYRVILPFHKCAKKFLETRKKVEFCKSVFYDESPLIQGEGYKKALQFQKAQEAFQQAVSLNPNDTDALLQLGLIEGNSGNVQNSLKRAQKALEVSVQKNGKIHPTTALSYNNIGSALKYSDHQGSLEAHQKALKIWLTLYDENYPLVATSYNNIGIILNTYGNHSEALDYHQKALKIRVTNYGAIHHDVAVSLSNIGETFQGLGKSQQALEYHQKALNVRLAIYNENHPDVALCYSSLGLASGYLGKIEALEYHQKALKIYLFIHGESHPDIALSYNRIGLTLGYLEQAQEAIEAFQKMLKICLTLYNENHPNVHTCYNNIGWALNKLGKGKEALDLHQKALMLLTSSSKNQSALFTLYHYNIGLALMTLGRIEEAIDYHQKALKIRLDLHGENHPDVAKSYSKLGLALKELGQAEEGLALNQKGLKIKYNFYGESHPELGISYKDIGEIFQVLGKKKEALDSYQKGLDIFNQFYRPTHPYIQSIQTEIKKIQQDFRKIQ